MVISSIPKAVLTWLDEQGYGGVIGGRSVAGGCINNGIIISSDSGENFFLKTNSQAPDDMFKREAEGLTELQLEGGPRIPQVFLIGDAFLLLEDLNPKKKSNDYARKLGMQLAVLHTHTNSQFGFEHDNYIGSTPQHNAWTEGGYTFFNEHRLGYQAKLANEKGLLTRKEVSRVERISARMIELIPKQPASLLHGDLWSGNAISDDHGQPAIIDPAVYYGWAEADLAMTTLFGGFGAEFFSGYEEVRQLESGYRDRFSLYNLYHLLNHLNLFGRGYYSQVKSILNRYA